MYYFKTMEKPKEIEKRLEYIRQELRQERIYNV